MLAWYVSVKSDLEVLKRRGVGFRMRRGAGKGQGKGTHGGYRPLYQDLIALELARLLKLCFLLVDVRGDRHSLKLGILTGLMAVEEGFLLQVVEASLVLGEDDEGVRLGVKVEDDYVRRGLDVALLDLRNMEQSGLVLVQAGLLSLGSRTIADALFSPSRPSPPQCC